MADWPEIVIKPIVGVYNRRPLRPYVETNIDKWLSPAQARRMAARLTKAADAAEELMRKDRRMAARLTKAASAAEELMRKERKVKT
jgi:hypothetical protein